MADDGRYFTQHTSTRTLVQSNGPPGSMAKSAEAHEKLGALYFSEGWAYRGVRLGELDARDPPAYPYSACHKRSPAKYLNHKQQCRCSPESSSCGVKYPPLLQACPVKR